MKYPGAVNLREVAGLPTGDGRRVRDGVLYRSGTPQLMDDDTGMRLAADLKLAVVADLRTPGETLSEGDGGLRGSLHQRLMVPMNSPSGHRDGTPVPRFEEVEDPLVPHYLAYLEGSQESILDLFRTLSRPEGVPALLHCTAGKDRTGAAVMLILDALGVEHAAIATEYAAGATDMAEVFAILTELPTYGVRLKEMPAEAKVATEETALRYLDELDQRFGGTVAWLEQAGLSEAELEALREQLLTD